MMLAFLSLLLLPFLAISALAAKPEGKWTCVSPVINGDLMGIAAVSKTKAIVAGAVNPGPINPKGGFGALVFEDGNITQTLVRTDDLCMITAVAMQDAMNGVVVGPSLMGASIGYTTTDGGETWAPTKGVSKGFSGAVSGDDIHAFGGGKYAYVAEYNSFENGTKCSHEPVSPQCSGVLLSRDNGNTYARIDWGGTDGKGTDASDGAFPSDNVWYISGGYVEAGSGPSNVPFYKATIMKTEDAGKSFQTVFNVTAPSSNPGLGVGGMNGIDCADENTCYAISSCDHPLCDQNDVHNKTHGRGLYIHKTDDGGKSWKITHFEYEKSANTVHVVSGDEVWVGGGEVGLSFAASLWHTQDGAASWVRHDLHGVGGTIFGIDMLPDGSGGFATSCNQLPECGIWSYSVV